MRNKLSSLRMRKYKTSSYKDFHEQLARNPYMNFKVVVKPELSRETNDEKTSKKT